MIKLITITYGDSQFMFIRTYIAENKKTLYTIGNKIVTKEEANEIYRNLRFRYRIISIKTAEQEANNNEIISYLKSLQNPYHISMTNEQIEENQNIEKIIKAFKELTK